jgi:hypothetical protein
LSIVAALLLLCAQILEHYLQGAPLLGIFAVSAQPASHGFPFDAQLFVGEGDGIYRHRQRERLLVRLRSLSRRGGGWEAT